MGICNSTSKKDTVQDRSRSARHDVDVRAHTQTASQISGPPEAFQDHPSAAVKIAQDPSRQRDTKSDDMDHYGQSYTNRRTQEYDILQNIVLKTQVNFIDVDQRPSSLDEEEQQIRLEHYAQQLTSQQAEVDFPRGNELSKHAAALLPSQDPSSGRSPQSSSPTTAKDRKLGVAGLQTAGLPQLARLSQHPVWRSQGAEDPVAQAIRSLRPKEPIAELDLRELHSFTTQVHQVLAKSFPDLAHKIIVTFEELEAEIADKPKSES